MKKNLIISAILLCTVWISYGQWTYDYLSEPKNAMAYGVMGDSLILAGGDGAAGPLSDVEVYHPASGQNYVIENQLSIARSSLAGVVGGGKFFCAGGAIGMEDPLSIVDVFDAQTQQWTVEQLSQGRFMISALSTCNKVFFIGGFVDFDLNGTDVIDIYDLESQTWSTLTLPESRGAIAAAVLDDLVIIAGGSNYTTFSDRVDIYNCTTNSWETAELSVPRAFATAVCVGNKVLIAGGITAIGVPSDVVDIYDVSTGEWSIASLFTPRSMAKAAAVGGKAYFAGGATFDWGWTDYSNVIDVYDPATGAWKVDFMAEPKVVASITGFGDSLIIAGGEREDGMTDLVEIYRHPTLIHVPGDYATIQEAINEASYNDTVLVADDTYYENINFIGKPILVASEYILEGDTNHINNTIINGSQPANPDIGSVVTFESGEDTTSVLCGFTITGGTGTLESSVNMRMGGAMQIKFSGGKFLNNYIHDNIVSYNGGVYGGGMQIGGPPISEIPWIVLRGNRIYNNEAKSNAEGAGGGGFICFYNLIMENNEISHNEANGHLGGDGGGVAIGGAFGLIEIDVHNNEVTYNEAKTDIGTNSYATLGGGMSFYWDVTGNVSNNVISFNSLEAPGTYWSWGPGAFIQDITSNGFVFENNRVIDNNTLTSQTCRGGGVSLLRSGGKYLNNVIQGNSASHGGGISIITSNEVGDTAILINNTITDNEANFGGGIYLMSSKSVIVNSIIWGNDATTGPAINQTGSTLEIRYSDVQGDVVWPGEGNIIEEPEFQSDGYHLSEASPLVNIGISTIQINGVWYECPPYDIDGEMRPWGNSQPEIGVDEVPDVSIGEPISTNNLPVNLYPNPADQMVTISVKNGVIIKEVTIYNQVGQKVYWGTSENNTLDVSKLQPGVYIIEVTTNQNKIREKLILE